MLKIKQHIVVSYILAIVLFFTQFLTGGNVVPFFRQVILQKWHCRCCSAFKAAVEAVKQPNQRVCKQSTRQRRSILYNVCNPPVGDIKSIYKQSAASSKRKKNSNQNVHHITRTLNVSYCHLMPLMFRKRRPTRYIKHVTLLCYTSCPSPLLCFQNARVLSRLLYWGNICWHYLVLHKTKYACLNLAPLLHHYCRISLQERLM